jgi:hypothetical protein
LLGLSHIPDESPPTIVHDYMGVGAWMERRWQTRDQVVTAVIAACRRDVRSRGLDVTYRHQRGHQSTWAGRDDFAAWNARADSLAAKGASNPA